RLQLVGRSDPGEHEQVGRADRTCAEDDLLAVESGGLLSAPHEDARRAAAVEEQALHESVRQDRQVGPVADWIEIADVRAPAHAVEGVERDGADAGSAGVVVIRTIREAFRPARLVERHLRREPFLARETAHRYRPLCAVEAGAKVEVPFETPEEGQDFLETPFGVAQRSPRVEVLRDSAEEDLAVDGARAARDLAPGY